MQSSRGKPNQVLVIEGLIVHCEFVQLNKLSTKPETILGGQSVSRLLNMGDADQTPASRRGVAFQVGPGMLSRVLFIPCAPGVGREYRLR